MSSHRHTVSVAGKSVYSSTVTNPDLAPYLQTANLDAALKASPTITALQAGHPADALTADEVTKLRALLVPVTPPPPPPPPAAGFLARYPERTSPLIINGGTDVEIPLSTLRGFTGAVAVVVNNARSVHIPAVDVADCVGAVYLYKCSGRLQVDAISVRNLGDSTIGAGHGNALQLNGCTFDLGGTITGVKSLGGWTEDMISIYQSGGASGAPLIVEYNASESPLADQPDYRSYTTNPRNSGSGIMVEDGFFLIVRHNTVLDSGQGGIGYNGGHDIEYSDNVIYGHQTPASNVGLYGLKPAGANVRWLRNRSWWRHGPMTGQPSGYDNAWWSTDGAIKGADGNVWMDATIDPASLVVVL